MAVCADSENEFFALRTSLLTVFKHNSIKSSRNNLSDTSCRGTADRRVFEEIQLETQDYRLKENKTFKPRTEEQVFLDMFYLLGCTAKI